MHRIAICLAAGATLLLAPSLAGAEEHVISQAGKKFAPKSVEAVVGDTLVFENDDSVGHTVYSDTPGFEFAIGKQNPGDSNVVALDKAGEFKVRCAIHPRMKLNVVVN